MTTKTIASALAKQILDWKTEITRLADLVAAAQGTQVAVVMFTPQAEGYEDVEPEVLVEDVLGVRLRGWPTGFQVDILNQGKSKSHEDL